MNNHLRPPVVMLATLAVIFASSSSCSAEQLPDCLQYDLTRGERIRTAANTYMMEHPETVKPEVLSLLGETTKVRGLETDLEWLADRLATDLKTQAKHKDAIEVFEALIATEKKMGATNISLVDHYNALAGAYAQAKQFNKAEAILQDVLTITEQFFGHASSDTANCLDNLANLQERQQNLKSEIDLRQKALDIRLSLEGSDHQWLIPSYRSLAKLNLKLGNKLQALCLYTQALEIAEEDHPAGSDASELSPIVFELRKQLKK